MNKYARKQADKIIAGPVEVPNIQGTAIINVNMVTMATYQNPTYYYGLYINGQFETQGSFKGGSPVNIPLTINFPIQQSGFYQVKVFVDFSGGGGYWAPNDSTKTFILTDG